MRSTILPTPRPPPPSSLSTHSPKRPRCKLRSAAPPRSGYSSPSIYMGPLRGWGGSEGRKQKVTTRRSPPITHHTGCRTHSYSLRSSSLSHQAQRPQIAASPTSPPLPYGPEAVWRGHGDGASGGGEAGAGPATEQDSHLLFLFLIFDDINVAGSAGSDQSGVAHLQRQPLHSLSQILLQL